jgi:hypothetical protein
MLHFDVFYFSIAITQITIIMPYPATRTQVTTEK